MNMKEFAALKPGDIIENHMSYSRGEVVSIDASGVRVRWAGAGMQDNSRSPPIPNAPTWHYGVNSTAWMHWSVANEAEQVPST